MRNRAFNLLAACSAICFLLTVVAWIAAFDIDPWKQFLTFGKHAQVSLRARGPDAKIVIFENVPLEPYDGGIIGISSQVPTQPPDPYVMAFGSKFGISFRFMRWRSGTLIWTFSVRLLYPLLLSSLLPATWLLSRRNKKRRGFTVLVATSMPA